MLIYVEADIHRLKLIARIDSNQCIHRYSREALCPICVSKSSSHSQLNNDISEALCENDCQFVIKTCFNQTNDPYLLFTSIMKNYSSILEEIEQAVIKLQVGDELISIDLIFVLIKIDCRTVGKIAYLFI